MSFASNWPARAATPGFALPICTLRNSETTFVSRRNISPAHLLSGDPDEAEWEAQIRRHPASPVMRRCSSAAPLAFCSLPSSTAHRRACLGRQPLTPVATATRIRAPRPLFMGSSRISGKRSFNLEEEEVAVPVAVCHPLHHLDAIVDAL